MFPGRWISLDHVEVSGQEQRWLCSRPAKARNHVAATGSTLHDERLQACAHQLLGEQLGSGKLVARWVGRVDAKQLLAKTKCMLRKLRIIFGHEYVRCLPEAAGFVRDFFDCARFSHRCQRCHQDTA